MMASYTIVVFYTVFSFMVLFYFYFEGQFTIFISFPPLSSLLQENTSSRRPSVAASFVEDHHGVSSPLPLHPLLLHLFPLLLFLATLQDAQRRSFFQVFPQSLVAVFFQPGQSAAATIIGSSLGELWGQRQGGGPPTGADQEPCGTSQ